MRKLSFNASLFVDKSHIPLFFHVYDCPQKDTIMKLIKFGSGVLSCVHDGESIGLGPAGFVLPNPSPGQVIMLSIEYVVDCCKFNTLLQPNGYILFGGYKYDTFFESRISTLRFQIQKFERNQCEADSTTPENLQGVDPSLELRTHVPNVRSNRNAGSDNTRDSSLVTTQRTRNGQRCVVEEATSSASHSLPSDANQHELFGSNVSRLGRKRRHPTSNTTFNEQDPHSKRFVTSQDPYTRIEREAILAYISRHEAYSKIKGVRLWKRMERKNIVPNCSWHSLKKRFFKSILLKMGPSDLNSNGTKRLKENKVKGSPVLKRLHSLTVNRSSEQGMSYKASRKESIIDAIRTKTDSNDVSNLNKMRKTFLKPNSVEMKPPCSKQNVYTNLSYPDVFPPRPSVPSINPNLGPKPRSIFWAPRDCLQISSNAQLKRAPASILIDLTPTHSFGEDRVPGLTFLTVPLDKEEVQLADSDATPSDIVVDTPQTATSDNGLSVELKEADSDAMLSDIVVDTQQTTTPSDIAVDTPQTATSDNGLSVEGKEADSDAVLSDLVVDTLHTAPLDYCMDTDVHTVDYFATPSSEVDSYHTALSNSNTQEDTRGVDSDDAPLNLNITVHDSVSLDDDSEAHLFDKLDFTPTVLKGNLPHTSQSNESKQELSAGESDTAESTLESASYHTAVSTQKMEIDCSAPVLSAEFQHSPIANEYDRAKMNPEVPTAVICTNKEILPNTSDTHCGNANPNPSANSK